jgi:hypothetical protein
MLTYGKFNTFKLTTDDYLTAPSTSKKVPSRTPKNIARPPRSAGGNTTRGRKRPLGGREGCESVDGQDRRYVGGSSDVNNGHDDGGRGIDTGVDVEERNNGVEQADGEGRQPLASATSLHNVESRARSQRSRKSVPTYNVKVLTGTAIHTPRKHIKNPDDTAVDVDDRMDEAW